VATTAPYRERLVRTPISIFVCGVQKGGTTSLYAHFREHPALSSPSRKELHFFDDETRDWSSPDYSAIDSFFVGDDGNRLRFDVTPIYSFWPPSIGRLRTYNPSAKLIILFRDPVDRAWSQWCMEFARGNELLSFSEAIREGRHRFMSAMPLAPERRVYSYVERGLYAEQVKRVLTYFPRDQTLFLRSRDLLDQHAATLAHIATFLEIPPFPDTGPKRENSRPSALRSSRITPEDRGFLAALLREDIREFERLTHLDVAAWTTLKEA
jgi:Sulfotransferase domain